MSSHRITTSTNPSTVQHLVAGQVTSAVARRLRRRSVAGSDELADCLQIVGERLGWHRVQLLLLDPDRGLRRAASWPAAAAEALAEISDDVRPLVDAATIAGCFVANRRDHRAGTIQDQALAAAGARPDDVTAVVGALEGVAGAVLVLQRPVEQPPGPLESVALEQITTMIGLAIERSTTIAHRDEARALLDLAPDFVAVVDHRGTLEFVSAGLQTMLGHSPTAWIGTDVTGAVHPDDLPRIASTLSVARDGELPDPFEVRVRNAAGAWVWVEVNSRLVPAATAGFATGFDAEHERVVLCVRNVDDRHRLVDQIIWQSSHDMLTGLWSRVGVAQRAAAGANDGQRSVLRFDVDRFHAINEFFGHAVGDDYLLAFADRLRRIVGPDDELARLGSDDFVVITTRPDALELAQACRERLEAPFRLAEASLRNEVSVGVARFGSDKSFFDVIADAEIALAAARSVPSRIAEFDDALATRVERGRLIESLLRRCLAERRGISVAFQPVVAAVQRSLVGFEALARWETPELGVISPAEFIPIAEATGLIVPLGRCVRRRALEDFASWRVSEPGARTTLAVNSSVAEIMQADWVSALDEDLTESGIEPEAVMIEVTESICMDRYGEVRDRLAAVRTLGCTVAFDDFGTGYASFAHLDDLPVDVLKIDQSLVGRVGCQDHRAEAVVAAIVRLAAALDLDIIAEGIVRGGQARVLERMGVTAFQGFWFGRPGPLPTVGDPS
jgi:diguanylate cyclase (GGDEF)-like protein/PAS domain S-box-containing protein